MKEEFLHYVWQYKKFDISNLKTVASENLTLLDFGQYLQQSGPDFFNAKIVVNNQKWAGNIEIHLKSSDWYLHRHEQDDNYNNVILHVVWEHDTPVFRKDNSEIPVLELRHYVCKEAVENYKDLVQTKSWIYCENQIGEIDSFMLYNWQERLFVERLERKSEPIGQLLAETMKDWDAVLFCTLAKSFGLNTNAEAFLGIAQSIPFTVLRKECADIENLEALFFGTANLFPVDIQDTHVIDLKRRYDYLSVKYKLRKINIGPIQFFKHRPDNFPTVRLAQLAMLYHKRPHLFSDVTEAKTMKELYRLFAVGTSAYWQTHYQFDKQSPKKIKQFSRSFIDLLVINTIIPMRFAFAKSQGKEISESLLSLLREVAAEKNAIVDRFAVFGVKAKNAFETQALLQLKNEYCNRGKCLQCVIGIQLLKQ